jgi:hydrogenase nickel incorporation protein HypB
MQSMSSKFMTQKISVVENILNANDQIASQNRVLLNKARLFSINLMASPGAGKTSLVEKTVFSLKSDFKIAVIDGDIATSLDAERAAEAGATAVQINTGGSCHLDAIMLHNALLNLNLSDFDFLIVENVGNLVCPASFQLGTHKSILVASIPEGDDKPYKYPGIYQGVDALVINKIDLLPYVTFKMDYFRKGVEILNPGLVTFPLSCRTSEGLDQWYEWIRGQVTDTRI